MKSIPIVLVHTGDSFYLKYALQSVREHNPLAKVFLICENTTENFAGVEKIEMKDFSKYSKVLEKIYVHKNKSNPAIELFCIKRWLLLLDFMEKNKYDKIFTMDSDVIIYDDVVTDAKNYSKFDVLLAMGASAGMTFINSPKVLSLYTNIVFDFYKNKIGKIEYEQNGTITDMSFWKEFKRRKKFEIGEITDIIESATYDAGLLIEQPHIPMKKGMKVVFFINKIPYAKTDIGAIRFKSLHCQGPTKFYMKYFVRGKISILDKLQIKIMMALRDNVSPILSNSVRSFFKKMIAKMGF